MKRNLLISIAIMVFSGTAMGQDKVALATKVSGQVTLTKATNQPQPLKRNTILTTGDQIKTGSDGVAVLMFIDDRSILRVQRNTQLTLQGERLTASINKQIDMQFGKIKAEVAEQRQGTFIVSTPTSVASVKGTDFWATSDPILGDIFLGITGLIEVTNLISNQVIEVGGGQVGTSTPDGATSVATYIILVGDLLTVSSSLLTMDPADTGEGGANFNGNVNLDGSTTYAGPDPAVGTLATVSGILNDDGSAQAIQVEIQEPDEAIEEDATAEPEGGVEGGTRNELRIQLEDADGELKEVIIIFE